jgi:serine/threonine protein kinase
MVLSLQKIHERKIIHRDVKPDNFLFSKTSDNMYLVDFGFSKIFPAKACGSLIGSKNYSSVNCHKLKSLGPKDDLESVGYIMLYLFLGSLPWSNDTDETMIIEKKKQIVYNKGLLPDFISKYFMDLTNLH